MQTDDLLSDLVEDCDGGLLYVSEWRIPSGTASYWKDDWAVLQNRSTNGELVRLHRVDGLTVKTTEPGIVFDLDIPSINSETVLKPTEAAGKWDETVAPLYLDPVSDAPLMTFQLNIPTPGVWPLQPISVEFSINIDDLLVQPHIRFTPDDDIDEPVAEAVEALCIDAYHLFLGVK